MNILNKFSRLTSSIVLKAVDLFSSPIYLYDEQSIISNCNALQSMPMHMALPPDMR